MADLRKRFGLLVSAHRKRSGLTQEKLAELADISVDMVSKIEVGASGARFPVIEKLAATLGADPAEFFSSDFPKGTFDKTLLPEITAKLARLSDDDLHWINGVIDAALRTRT